MSTLGADVGYEELRSRMAEAEMKLRVLPAESAERQPALNMMMDIARNMAFRQKLSCRYFISFVYINPQLADYIIGAPDFLSELDYGHLMKLRLRRPEREGAIMDQINVMKAQPAFQTWATDILSKESKGDLRTEMIALLDSQQAEMDALMRQMDSVSLRQAQELAAIQKPPAVTPQLDKKVGDEEEEDYIIQSPREPQKPPESTRMKKSHQRQESDFVILESDESDLTGIASADASKNKF